MRHKVGGHIHLLLYMKVNEWQMSNSLNDMQTNTTS